MCGIAACFSKDAAFNAIHVVRDRFEKQKSRGTSGFGLALLEGTKLVTHRETELDQARKMLSAYRSNVAFFHHRLPTSSENRIDQTHPILIQGGKLKRKYLFLHNGVLSNYFELYDKHIAEGYEYSTEYLESHDKKKNIDYVRWNDSETLGYEVAKFVEGVSESIEAKGSAAFILVELGGKKFGTLRRVHFGRNNLNPLKIEVAASVITLASEGKGADVPSGKLWTFDVHSQKTEEKPMEIPTSYSYKSYDWKGSGKFGGYTGSLFDSEPIDVRAEVEKLLEDEGIRDRLDDHWGPTPDVPLIGYKTDLEKGEDYNRTMKLSENIKKFSDEVEDVVLEMFVAMEDGLEATKFYTDEALDIIKRKLYGLVAENMITK